jgi:hypothetical protein
VASADHLPSNFRTHEFGDRCSAEIRQVHPIEFAVKNIEPVAIAGVFGVMRGLELQEMA